MTQSYPVSLLSLQYITRNDQEENWMEEDIFFRYFLTLVSNFYVRTEL